MTIKIKHMTRKHFQSLSNSDLKKRLIQSHLSRDICSLQDREKEELRFDLEIYNIQEEIDKRQKDESMIGSRFRNEIPNFESEFYKSKLKQCITPDQVEKMILNYKKINITSPQISAHEASYNIGAVEALEKVLEKLKKDCKDFA